MNNEEKLDAIHDALVDFEGKGYTVEEVTVLLPPDIEHLADQWGWYDSEVRDKLYLFAQSLCQK